MWFDFDVLDQLITKLSDETVEIAPRKVAKNAFFLNHNFEKFNVIKKFYGSIVIVLKSFHDDDD